MNNRGKYEVVVGLEVHAQLSTHTKLFCADATDYGAAPNTQVSPVSLGHPGTLPRLNRKAVEFAVKMGLACNCSLNTESYFARKNYFYPDLSKGYQVTQDADPVCKGGFVTIETEGTEKQIRLNRIHIEEDAGKSLHDVDPEATAIDYNRAGTPLIEIVSEPDIRNGDEAYAYISEIRRLVRYLDICDGNMEEGSLRCDVNISVRPEGKSRLGTRIEIKNLNSLRHVKRAIEWESERLIESHRNGATIRQETRSFDADKGQTFSIREKEDAHDYRYFPEPDLPPFHISDEMIADIRNAMPRLQKERISHYTEVLQLSDYDARVLTYDRTFSDYFEQVVSLDRITAKTAANWMLGPVRSWLKENQCEISSYPLTPEKLASVAALAEEKITSNTAATGKILPYLLANPDKDAREAARELNLLQESGVDLLEPVIDMVLEKFSGKVAEYKKGKKGLLSLFVGEVMKQTKGKADPKITNELLLEKLRS